MQESLLALHKIKFVINAFKLFKSPLLFAHRDLKSSPHSLHELHFVSIFSPLVIVATPLWPSVRVKPNTWENGGFGILRDSRMFRAQQQGAKHLALGFSWCHCKRS